MSTAKILFILFLFVTNLRAMEDDIIKPPTNKKEIEAISKNTLPKASFRMLLKLVHQKKLSLENIISFLNSCDHHGALGFSAEQGINFLKTYEGRHGDRDYSITEFVCNNTFDIWNTKNGYYMDGCFYYNVRASDLMPKSNEKILWNMKLIRVYLKEQNYQFKLYPLFSSSNLSESEKEVINFNEQSINIVSEKKDKNNLKCLHRTPSILDFKGFQKIKELENKIEQIHEDSYVLFV